LGDPERHVGAQVSVYSFSTLSDGFGERSAIDLQLHRVFANGWAVAIGRENIHSWGSQDTRRDSGSSRYAVGSRVFSLGDRATFSTMMVTLGVGDGRFQSEEDFWLGKNRWKVFGSAAVRVARPVSLIAEWTGQDVLLATSITPLRNHRLGITLGYTDITGSAGDGTRLVLGMSFTHDFGRARTD
jgi:hypothetical protein